MSIEERIRSIERNLTDNVSLIAVSKTRNITEIQEAYNCGIRDFGENKVQELVDKYERLPDVRWHFIGKLQRNKVKYLVDKVFLIHSLDSISLLREIEKQYGKNDKIANVLIEVNIGREDSKSGILEEDLKELMDAIEECKYIKVKGLMAIIPKGDDEKCRYYFRKMRNLFEELSTIIFKNIQMDYLSMGMTHDYRIAIEEGANIIRVGEGIFGKRN